MNPWTMTETELRTALDAHPELWPLFRTVEALCPDFPSPLARSNKTEPPEAGPIKFREWL